MRRAQTNPFTDYELNLSEGSHLGVTNLFIVLLQLINYIALIVLGHTLYYFFKIQCNSVFCKCISVTSEKKIADQLDPTVQSSLG